MSINNKRSYTEYTITQPTTDFAIGFDDFDEGSKDNILVTLNGVLVESLGYAAIRKNESTVTITPAITEGTVRLTRETDIDEPFHKFTAGALFSAKSMDENFQQVRHSQQEVRDGFVFLEYNTNGIVQESKVATAQAKAATVEATASAVRAESAADTAVQAVGSLQGVVDAATTATTKANTATAIATTAASQATTATTTAQNATSAATIAKQEATAAAANANAATVGTLAATGRANEAADVVADLVVGKVRAQDVGTVDGSTQDVKNTEFRSELDALPFEDGTLADTFVTATANGTGTVARSQRDVNSDIVTLRDFGAHPSNPDNSQFIQNAFDWSAATGRQILGVTGDVYTLGTRTFPLAGRVLTLNGDFDFDGRGCTFKIADNFGDYYALIWRIKGDTRIKNLIIDENTTNNPIANLPQTNEQNFRTAMFLWGEKNDNTCEVSNIQFRDWCGIWQITTTNFSRGFVKNCTLFATAKPITWVDRTSMYIGIHGAEISGNKMHGNATSNVATTPIECHASGQHIHGNYANGYRNSIYIVNDPQDTLTLDTCDVIVENNQFLNTAQGICLWNSFPLRGFKNIKIRDNAVRINSHLLTGAHSYPAEYGIGSLYGGWHNSVMADIEILSNNIEFVHHEGELDSTIAYGIQLNCYTADSYYARNIKIKGNTIKNSFSHGINLDFLTTNGADSYIQLLEIENNTIIDAGVVTPNAYGVRFQSTRNLRAVKVKNNTAIDTRAAPRMIRAVGIFAENLRGEVELGDNKLKTINFAGTYLYGFDAIQRVRQNKDGITIKPMTVDLPTHYAESGSTLIESNTGLEFTQATTGISNNWIIKASSSTSAVGAYVPKGTEITNTNPSADIYKWVALTAGYALFDWKASTPYKLNDGVYSNGQVFKCTQAGTSGTTAIGWSADEIIDGTVKWVMLPDPIATWKAHYIKTAV